MFLHLGGDVLVEMKNVIAIIDIEKEKTEIIKDFIKVSSEEGFLEEISDENKKSLVITEMNNKSKIFLSPITSTTLLKRTNFINNISIDKA